MTVPTETRKQQANPATAKGFPTAWLLGLIGVMVTGIWFVSRLFPGGTLAVLLGLSEKSAWYFTRSTGTVAYLLLAGSTIWGLLLSTKIIKETVPAALSLAMHNILSWLAVAFTGLHGLALLFDSYYAYGAKDLLIPFIGPYRPGAVGLGILGFYLMVLTSASFYWLKRLGQTWWRRLHYLTFAAFGLVTVHGLMAGTDSGDPGMRGLYLGSVLLVFFLTIFRILAGGDRRPASRRAERPAA
jgi:DMSO/TMAO reductase YedYZ heme-binding membrane subunit